MKLAQSDIRDRHKMILLELKKNNTVYVNELSKSLGVTGMTIRRDLIELEKSGYIERCYGGARLIQDSLENLLLQKEEAVKSKEWSLFSPVALVRIMENSGAKRAIAKKAAELVNDNDIIFMNSGTTGLYVPQFLTGKHVRIITNNSSMALVERSIDTELTITGGEHYARAQSYVGPIAKNTIAQVIATTCILSVSGISLDNGITTSIFPETEINNMMLSRCSGQRIVIADSSKINKSCDFVTSPLSDIDILVTDSAGDDQKLDKLREAGITVYIADD